MFVRYISFILTFLLFACSNNIVFAKEYEKGIKYIGEMNVQRALHGSKKLNDGNILILGGYNKMVEYSDGRNPPSLRQEYTKEKSSEIYNLIDNTFKVADLKTDLPEKKGIFQILSQQEENKIKQFFEEKNISFDIIGYEKIDEEKILCISLKHIFRTAYGMSPIAEYFAVYDLKTKKINPIVSFNNTEVQNLSLKSFKTNNGTKIFFIYYFEDSSRYLQTAIFNIDKNIFEKVSKPIETKWLCEFSLFQLENQDIIVTENNVFKYILDVKKQELKPLRNYGFRMNEGANVTQLNSHQLLITGGYAINNTENTYLEFKRNISKSAYIYSF